VRRSAFIASVAALAACSRAPKPSAGDLDTFMAKSRMLTGYSDLDAHLGAAYLNIAGASPSDREILTLWYTGVNSTTTVTWLDALAWRACAFTKPPSQCAAPGSWHLKP
jgi:hypothetical protein